MTKDKRDVLAKVRMEFTLQGLVFMPAGEKPENFFPSVHSWVTGGRPNNAVIYDTVDVLNDTNIPICDAVAFNGMFCRTQVMLPAKKVKVRLLKQLVVTTRPAKALKKVDGILKADAQDHHKMHYA